MLVTAWRRLRSQAVRGNRETSGMLGRRLNRGSGAGSIRGFEAAAATAAASETRGRAPWRRLRYPSAASCA